MARDLPAGGARALTAIRLCRADAIAEGEARGFVHGSGVARRAVVVLRHRGRLAAYVNSCPHQGTPLELAPDRFFTATGDHLICHTHGALFRPEDGVCVAGPCAGQGLAAAPVALRDGAIWLEDGEG